MSTHVDGDGHSSQSDDLKVQGGFHDFFLGGQKVEVNVCESQVSSSCQSFKSLWEVFGDDVIMNASVFVSMLNMNDSETFHCTF